MEYLDLERQQANSEALEHSRGTTEVDIVCLQTELTIHPAIFDELSATFDFLL